MIRYPLATTTWDEAEVDAIQRVIDSGRFSMGENVSEFETTFANYVGSRYAVMVNSGSSANLLAVAALFYRQRGNLNIGDEVIVPAVSWPTTYYPLYQYGLKIKFVDIDRETLNYDLTALRRAVSPRTRMIFAVNLLGNPNNFTEISELIDGKDIILIEDNCESLGATFAGRQAGTFGLMGTYSTFFSHHISTMEGGVIVTDDEELFHILLSLRAHGWTRNLPEENKVTGTKSSDHFEESFRFVLPGYNVRPLEMSGAIGIQQLKKLPSLLESRRKNASKFLDLFADNLYIKVQREIGTSSWFGFSLLINEAAPFTRRDVVKLLQENGVECRPIVAGNFAKNPVVKLFNHEVFDRLNNAEYVDKNGLFVGNHHYDISGSLDLLYDVLRSLY